LQVDLLQRHGKRILLTSAGQLLGRYARGILRQIEILLQELTVEPEQVRGSLHVGVVPILDMALMPPLLGMFAASHPAVSLTVEEISSTEIETAIEEGRMDVGLGFLTRHSPRLRYERLCEDQFALIVSTEHPWAERDMIDVRELNEQPVLQLPDTFVMRRMTDAVCQQHRVRPRIVAEINSIETLLRSLRPLQAAALMPKIALRDSDGLVAIPLKGKNLALEIGLLRLIDSGATAAVEGFTKLARKTVPLMIRKQSAQRASFLPARAAPAPSSPAASSRRPRSSRRRSKR
jgi:LysR family cyn operon transcriptional activator